MSNVRLKTSPVHITTHIVGTFDNVMNTPKPNYIT